MKKILKIILIHGSKKKRIRNIKKKFFLKNNFLSKNKICCINRKNQIIKNIKKNIKYKFKNCLIIPIFIINGKHIKIDTKNILKSILKIIIKFKITFKKVLGQKKNFFKILKNNIKKLK